MQQARNLQQRIVSGGFSYGGATLLMLGAWSLSYLRSPQTSYLLGGLGCLVVGLLLNWLNKTFAIHSLRCLLPLPAPVFRRTLGGCISGFRPPFPDAQFSGRVLTALCIPVVLHAGHRRSDLSQALLPIPYIPDRYHPVPITECPQLLCSPDGRAHALLVFAGIWTGDA